MKRLLMEVSINLMLNFLKTTNLHTIFEPVYGGIGHILMFHRIIPQLKHNLRINKDIELTQKEFKLCIEYYLKNNYTFVSLDELSNILFSKKINNEKLVVFTFDDGYSDILKYACPLMEKYNIPFTLNITTGIPDRTIVLWWYLLEDLLLNQDEIYFKMLNKEYYYKCKTNLEKFITFRKLRGVILRSDEEDYLLKLQRIFEPFSIDLYKKTEELGMNWDQIIAISKNPNVTIGAHSVNHLALNKISQKALEKEMMDSARRIEEKIGKKVEHFCYPFGRAENGPREFEAAKACGFKTATTTRIANVFLEHSDHLCCLPRIYKVGKISKAKYLDVLASGALSALTYKFRRIITT